MVAEVQQVKSWHATPASLAEVPVQDLAPL